MKTNEIKVEQIWNDKKRGAIKNAILSHSASQPKSAILANKLLSIQYQLEDYIKSENAGTEVLRILDFVKMYLKALNLTKKELANYFEMRDSNLHKYLSGERKLNANLALKLSTFSHTKPEQWYRIEIKNELIALKKENIDAYKKYDYLNLIEV